MWTASIHAEWIDAVMRQRPELNGGRLERVAELMNSAVPDCLVVGFEPLEAGLASLPDPNDRHVLAAAIHCGAQEIVTFNLRDSGRSAGPLRYSSRPSGRVCRTLARPEFRGRVRGDSQNSSQTFQSTLLSG